MSDTRTKEADLAAIKARCELNYTVASHPMFASNPIVIAALANAKASDAAFLAAVAEADAARGFRIWSTYRHVRQAGAASDSAHAALRAAIESAEDEHNQPQASQDAASQEPSDSELRDLALNGRAADAIFWAFARDAEQPLDAPELEAHLTQQFRNESSRDLARVGYRLRLAEELIQGPRMLAARGQVDEILRSNTSTQLKTKAIAEYFENHGIVGLGDPIRPYVLVRFDEIRDVCERFVGMIFENSDTPTNERDAELYHGFVSYGYAYRVAEELVRPHYVRSERSSLTDATVTSGDVSTAQGAWDYFRGKPNTKTILREKANVVVHLIINNCDAGLLLAAAFRDRNESSDIRLGDHEARQSMVETAALLLTMVDQHALKFLGSAKRDVFMDALEAGVAGALQDKGAERGAFLEFLLKRYKEYSHYRKWLPEKGEAANGTLFCEFGKKVGAIFGIGRDIAFDIVLTNGLLSAFVRWKLDELFAGKYDSLESLPETRSNGGSHGTHGDRGGEDLKCKATLGSPILTSQRLRD
jgi:hypothetical protein